MEQNVLAVAGDEDIVEAVVIVVTDGDAGGPYAAAQARFRGHIGEGAVAVVVIQADGRIGRRRPGAASARQDDDILPAIVVVIDEGGAATHRFEDVIDVPFVAIDHRRMKSRGCGHIDEFGVERQAGRFAARCSMRSTGRHGSILRPRQRTYGGKGEGR